MTSACIPSLHPIYTDEDIVFEESLLGVWAEPNSDETWAFTRSQEKGNAYRLVYADGNGKRGAFVTHLAKIKGQLFLDLFPEEPELESNDFYKGHLMPVHTFMHVAQIEPKLQLSALDADWLGKHLEKKPRALKHEIVDDTIVLTASTKKLQAFYIKHLKTEGAYDDPSEPMDRVETDGKGP